MNKTKRIDELDAQVEHLQARIDNLRDVVNEQGEKFYDFSKLPQECKFIIMPKGYGKSFFKYSHYTKEQLINRIIELEFKRKGRK